MIDCHVHLLDPKAYPYPANSEGYRPQPDETGTGTALLDVMKVNGIDRAVLVAASVYGARNESVLETLADHPNRFRVVAGVDPAMPQLLADLADIPGVVGIRINLTDDRRMYDAARIDRLLSAACDTGLIVTIQAPPATARVALQNAGDAIVVLDHIGRPDLTGGLSDLQELARRPNTWLKLSGGFRVATEDWPQPTVAMRETVALFPRSKLIWGSDWPFINLAGVKPVYRDCLTWARALTDADLAANAAALFWDME